MCGHCKPGFAGGHCLEFISEILLSFISLLMFGLKVVLIKIFLGIGNLTDGRPILM